MPVIRSGLFATCALACSIALVPAAHAQSPAPRSVTAVASGRVVVDPDVARNSRAIGMAVDAARDRAISRAIANAREEAQKLAGVSGLTLGAILAVEEPAGQPFYGPFGPSLPYGAEGTFGPGKFCGRIRTPIIRRTPDGRRVRTGRFRTRFGCRVPSEVSQTVRVTFAVT